VTLTTKQDLTPAVRFFVDLSDGRRPVKCEIVHKGYLTPFDTNVLLLFDY